MKKQSKSTRKEPDKYLRLRVPVELKRRLRTIASERTVSLGSRPVTVSDVAREYLLGAAQKEKAA